MSEYRFVSFVPVVGQYPPRGTLYRYKDRDEDDDFDLYASGDEVDEHDIAYFEFIRPADSETPSEPVPATIQATPAMTVREQFAAAAMRSLIHANLNFGSIPQLAVTLADELIKELSVREDGK